MKKLYFLIVGLVGSLSGYSQTILDKPETTSRTVSDPQAVILANGFHAKADAVNPFVAKIGESSDHSGGGPTDSDAGSTNPFGQVGFGNFHDTQGSIEVNGGGQLQYTLPIALPPGVKSVAPQMNLVYTSGSGNGIAGYGWSLSGITSISRMGRTIDKDGEVKGVQLDYSDYYSFNGQRLILKSGEYGKDGAEYVTEKYSNVKIKSLGSKQGVSGPMLFHVTFEDGSQAWYGDTEYDDLEHYSAARTSIEYNIIKWKDAQGNYITYNYEKNKYIFSLSSIGGEVTKIKKIQWGGNEDITPPKPHFNEIVFNYVDRDLKELSYVQGYYYNQDQLLSNIVVNSNGSPFKKYEIAYKKDINGTNYQFVDKITEYNSKGDAANPVMFEYETSTIGGWKVSSTNNDNSTHKVHGDFNGDGKIDMLKYSDAVRYCKRYRSRYDDNQKSTNRIDPGEGGEMVCVEWVDEPAGIYLFSSVFDDNQPKKILVSSEITKESLPNALPITLKGVDNSINTRQGLAFMHYINRLPGSTRADIEIKVYSFSDTKLNYEFSKIIPNASYDVSTDGNPWENGWYTTTTNLSSQLKEIDVNGDGLSEIILTAYDNYCEPTTFEENTIPNTECHTSHKYIIVYMDHLISQDKSYSIHMISPSNMDVLNQAITGDFNGNGKTDFLTYGSNDRPLLIEFSKDSYNQLSPFTNNFYLNEGKIEGIKSSAVTGDFNGDGKTDLMVPASEYYIPPYNIWNQNTSQTYTSDWYLYLSTGKSFIKKTISNFAMYKPFEGGDYMQVRRSYYAQDLNKDGKSDFIVFHSFVDVNSRSNDKSKFHIQLYENKGESISGNIVFENKKIQSGEQYSKIKVLNDNLSIYPFIIKPVKAEAVKDCRLPPCYYTEYDNLLTEDFAKTDKIGHFSPVFGNFRINTSDENILVFHQNRLIKYSYYDFSKSSRLTSITQGGLKTEVEYKELDPVVNPGFYAAVKKEQYPYMEMDKVSQSYAVAQLRQYTNSYIPRKQDFRYRGFIANLHGKGMIGFRKTARSSWYADGFENTKIWSGAEIDPLNNAVPKYEWSIKTNDEGKIFPTNISFGNTELISLKQTEYQTEYLLNNAVVTSYSDTDKHRLVTALVPVKTTQKDFIKDITTVSQVQYGSYYLPSKTTTTINGGFAVSSTDLSYLHNPSGEGKDYFIGRPETKIESLSAYGDTKGAKEEYTYENNLLKTKKSYDRIGDDWVMDTYTYDGFGNIIQKIITNKTGDAPQIAKTEYDALGRFVNKKTDNLGLETTITYNDWGQVRTQTDPLGNTLTNIYDDWGKLLTSKTNLGGTTTYTYQKDATNGDAIVTEYAPTGNIKHSYTNRIGQQYKTLTKGFSPGSYIAQITVYDILGRKIAESEPYEDGSSPVWNTIAYDDSVFPAKVTATAFNGKKMETSISGRTTFVKELNGYGRTTSKTTDAVGNVVTSTDKGGSINFSFNAAGENTAANYAGNIVTTKYDHWGRKIEFHDPSNGLYKFEYQGYFGAISKEISPKGYKSYAYNDKGQLKNVLEKSNDGVATDKSISFTYNAKGMLTLKNGYANGRAYSSYVNYDAFGRVLSSGENSNGKHFVKKAVTYDNRGRVISYEKGLYSSGIYTKTSIENVYSPWSGDLQQVKEKTSGKTLWELQETNSKGQVKRARLGATEVNNAYDANNFLSNVSHVNTGNGATLLQLGYSFNAIKNELNSRTRGGDLNIIETFTYDDNNRLVNWTNPKTGKMSFNTYDEKGRITENDQVGHIKFENTQSVYRPSGTELNVAGEQNYLNNLIQKISYNENNDPIFIDGEKGDVRFTYGLTEMRQMATYGGNFNENTDGAFTKYYSEDGSYEIIRNNQTGQEKHILYIGGSPYESEIVYLKDFTEAQAKFVFLHKDYLGSILAISDEAGNAVEQRHFDAWGNFTHLKVGNGAIITDHLSIINHQLLIDRGYTSHEHFSEVGIIHMNGRLYDPLLRRFLNADENIQDPHNTQNYNKYGYVMNNPLMYNDPSGEFLGLILGFIVKHIIAIVIGAYIGFGTYFGSMALSGQQPTFLGALKSVFFGAVSSAATAGIGDIFKMGDVVKALGDGLVLAQAGAHSITQGVLSVLQGNSFLTSAASGFLGSLGASGWQAAAGKFANSAVGTIAFGALSGGVGAELTGGNFWQGAVIGGIVAGLNHVSHLGNRIISPKPKPESNLMKILKGERWDLNGDGILSKAEADYWWLYGKGQDITVDNRLISWKGLPMSSNIPISGRFGIATHDAFISLPYETASTYGGTSFIRTGLYTAEVQSQSYHYKFRLNFNPNDILRDVMNHIGHPKQGGRGNLQYGKDYMIKYKNPTIYFNHEKIRSNDGSSYYYIAR